MRYTIWLLVLIFAVVPETHAQANPDSVKHRNDCRLAQQVIETGHPAPHTSWALGYIGYCDFDTWGRTMAAGVRRLRTSSDTAELVAVWAPTQWLRDRALYEAALEIAGDRAASVPARVFAFRALLLLNEPRLSIRYEDMVSTAGSRTGARGGCSFSWRRGGMPYTGTALPADFKDRITAVAKRVRGDSSEPEPVRVAAKCF